MTYDKEFLDRVMQMGILNYPLSKVLNVMEVSDEKQFKKDFYKKGSSVYKSYQRGRDRADFLMDAKVLEKAKAGDLTAIKMFLDRIRDTEIEREEEERSRL